MHVILMSDRLGRTVSFSLDYRHGLAVLAVVLAVLVWSGFMAFHLAKDDPPVPEAAAASGHGIRFDQLAQRVGELQARLAHIRDVGERVAKKVGIPLNSTASTEPPGEGGPLVSVADQPTSAVNLARMLDDLTREMDQESDRLTILDVELLTRQAHSGHLAMERPVDDAGYVSSTFGLRPDPFTGKLARHEGLDFADDRGAPVLAATSGIVIAARTSPDYGNVIDIDHGNGLVTRYGHCLHLLVKVGDMVKRGQEIAQVGSTGRSTGPHLHFEVRKDGAPVNPVRYLAQRS